MTEGYNPSRLLYLEARDSAMRRRFPIDMGKRGCRGFLARRAGLARPRHGFSERVRVRFIAVAVGRIPLARYRSDIFHRNHVTCIVG